MKKRFKKFFRILQIIICLIFNKIKHKAKGYQMTEKGKLLLEYLSKVILEDYEPQTMTDYMHEEAFNPEKLEGEARLRRAEAIFLLLSEY